MATDFLFFNFPETDTYVYNAVCGALRIIDKLLLDQNSLLTLFGPVADLFAVEFPKKLGKKFVLTRDDDLLLEVLQSKLNTFSESTRSTRQSMKLKFLVKTDSECGNYMQAFQHDNSIHLNTKDIGERVLNKDPSKWQVLLLIIKLLHEICCLFTSNFHIYCERLCKQQHPLVTFNQSRAPNHTTPETIGTESYEGVVSGDCGSGFEDIHCGGRVIDYSGSTVFPKPLYVVAFDLQLPVSTRFLPKHVRYFTIHNAIKDNLHNIWNPNNSTNWQEILTRDVIQEMVADVVAILTTIHDNLLPSPALPAAKQKRGKKRKTGSLIHHPIQSDDDEDTYYPIEPLVEMGLLPTPSRLGRKN